jgi:hypothetical protein
MLLGEDDRYLELEFGPHGHYLVLRLHGCRNVVDQGLPLNYASRRNGDVWAGSADVPLSWLPPGPLRINAFAIHGVGPERRYLAWKPSGGLRPDFHVLEVFAPPPWTPPA